MVCSTTDLYPDSRMPSRRADSPPPQTLYRGWTALSKPMTDKPARLNSYAAVAPAGPIPTTSTSHTVGSGNGFMEGRQDNQIVGTERLNQHDTQNALPARPQGALTARRTRLVR